MWYLKPADEPAVARIAADLGLPRAVARVLWTRGYRDPDAARTFLDLRDGLAGVSWPLEAPGLVKAVARIRRAAAAGERIGLYGDYDCDGVTSAAILYRYLSRGLKADVLPRLPDRFKDGYGVHPQAVDRLHADGCRLIVTCDNGISAHAAASRARDLGIDMIVTDHHTVGPTLPDAYALVHPQLEFPEFRNLCGAGVAFLLTIALEGGLTPSLEWFLDLVALGTVADVVPLTGVNRALVWAGLSRMRAGAVLPGVRALAAAAEIDLERVTTRDLAFGLCPRLNAAGRLETPDIGFQLLISNDRNGVKPLAERLDAVNQDRRARNAELETEVLAQIETEVDVTRQPFIVLAGEQYHHGIVGIVAGRVAEKYRTPVILFAPNGDGTWRGSGRSPAGFHLYEALAACSEHLAGFGGHAQAAGCRVADAGLPALREALNRYVADIGWSRPRAERWLDALLPFGEADGDLLAAVSRLEPFGHQLEAPVFGLLGARVAGVRTRNDHLFLMVDDGDRIEEVIAWGQAEQAPRVEDRLDLAYSPRFNTFRGETRIQRIASQFAASAPSAPAGLDSVPVRLRADTLLLDARRRGWQPVPGASVPGTGCILADDPAAVGVYGDAEPAAGVWLRAGQPVPAGLAQIVCLAVPADEATWRGLVAGARTVILAWDGAPGPQLAPDTLQAVYRHLAGRTGLDLFLAVEKAPVPLAEAQAAVAIFREAGLVATAGGTWKILEPPDGAIGLSRLAAYQAYRQARAFQERLDRASLEEARRLATLEPVEA
ncbi:MAG: single-stranded-DNA-specific exonuclease RecJ [Candidatus Sericytochromatia bacterium]|nr:single-stranded-DNA-specific exonuclease RecJ [Candidatus Tanganyikabacteria bacterium]